MSQGARGDGAHPSRKALLVGNSAYVDPAITPLLAPRTDIEKLGALLSDPAIGGFDVAPPQLDISAEDFRLAISNLFADAKKDDLLLLYFAGHGVRDNDGRLYLAVKKTQIKRLNATALPAQFILDEMSRSASRRKVLILDCCHAGAVFEDGTLRARSASYDAGLVRSNFLPRGTGTYILAASQSGQSAFEEIDPETKTAKSIYTSLIVDAIRTGDAAPDSKDITVSEIHDYIREHRNRGSVETTPELTVFNQSDTLVLCSNPNVRKPLDQRLLDQLVSQSLAERSYAIEQLARVLVGKDTYKAGLVQTAFDNRLNTDDPLGKERDFELREKLKAALDAYQVRIEQSVSTTRREEERARAGDERDTPAVTENSISQADKQAARPLMKRVGIVILVLALLVYLGLVFLNIAAQPRDYDLTMANIVRLAVFARPETKQKKAEPAPPPDAPKIGPIENLVLGKWRVLLFDESDCGKARGYARSIRRIIGKRVDLTISSKAGPYNLVVDTGDDKPLADNILNSIKSMLLKDNNLRAKISGAEVLENTGEILDENCMSDDQQDEIGLSTLIAGLLTYNQIPNSNKIVDLFNNTVNYDSRIKISTSIIRTSNIEDYSHSLYALRTLSFFKPCYYDTKHLMSGFYIDYSKSPNLDPMFVNYLQLAKDNICVPTGE
ncbi:caspase family protein [Mesorhizobium neociceri]|uniref:Caspase family protein n=1 Tax=Mesorhizobium neociceri TaxID=1307853 RepID=A0A838B0W4_9HYPH|nr:caspase family protein [Mesorhizobium neociceri]MBA1139985.1 caspase family protein [Mesorhizobium neociceri]